MKKDPLGCKPTPSLSAPELAWGWSCLVLLGGRPLSHRYAIAYAKRHGRRAGLASIALAVTASKRASRDHTRAACEVFSTFLPPRRLAVRATISNPLSSLQSTAVKALSGRAAALVLARFRRRDIHVPRAPLRNSSLHPLPHFFYPNTPPSGAVWRLHLQTRRPCRGRRLNLLSETGTPPRKSREEGTRTPVRTGCRTIAGPFRP